MGEMRPEDRPVDGHQHRTPANAFAGRPERITLPQQVVVNALAALMAGVKADARDAMLLGILRDDLPGAQVAPAHSLVAKVLVAAVNVLAAAPNRGRSSGGASWAMECWHAQDALREFFVWRCACAQEALRPPPPMADDEPKLELVR